MATFNPPSGGQPTLVSTTPISSANAPANITWGTATLDNGGSTYIYGSEDVYTGTAPNCVPEGRRLHIKRVPTGNFSCGSRGCGQGRGWP
ncbi:MAG: hypothetical protein ABIQ26_09940 [Streptosporangiaceae bacterium]